MVSLLLFIVVGRCWLLVAVVVLLLFWLLLLLLFCCYCRCFVYIYIYFYFCCVIAVCLPKNTPTKNTKSIKKPCFIVFFAFYPWQGFAQRKANNPKQKIVYFLLCFSSFLCFCLLCLIFLLFLLYLPSFVSFILYFVSCFLSHFLPVIFSLFSSFSFELQRYRIRGK